MNVQACIWFNLCELYPQTAQRLKELAIVKREILLHYMDTNIELSAMNDCESAGIPDHITERNDDDVDYSELCSSGQSKSHPAFNEIILDESTPKTSISQVSFVGSNQILPEPRSSDLLED